MTLNRGLGPEDGVFESAADLQAAKIPNNRRVEIVAGTRYNVQPTDLGGGLPLASGNFANPISSTDPQTAVNTGNISTNASNISNNTAAIADLDSVILRTGGGALTSGAQINQLRDSGAYTLPLANTVSAGGLIVIELNDTLSAQAPTITRAGSDLIKDNAGTDTSILFVGATRITLTSDGVSEWEL